MTIGKCMTKQLAKYKTCKRTIKKPIFYKLILK